MMQSRLLLPLLAIGLVFAGSVEAVPTRLSADAGEVRDIKFASGSGATAVLFAATQGGGVFKSANAGVTWAPTGLNSGYAWKIAVSPLAPTLRIYAATDTGLWKTVNGGTSWTQQTFDPARAVAIDPGSVTNDTVLLGVPGQGILRSTDSGVTFAMQSSGLDSADILNIVYQSSGTAYAVLDCNSQDTIAPNFQGNWGGVFKATNANAGAVTIAWSSFINGGGVSPLPSKCVHALATQGTAVFAGLQDPITGAGGIYRSTGAGWTAPTGGNPNTGDIFGVEALAADRASATGVHAGAIRVGVWSSADTGVSYSQKVDPSPCCDPDMWTRIYALETVPGLANTVLVAAKGVGIMRTTVINTSPTSVAGYWVVAPGVKADRVRGLANHANVAPATYWMALESGGVMKSVNSGANWAEFNKGFDFGAFPSDILLSAQAIAADPSSTSLVLVGTRGGGLLNLNVAGDGWDNSAVPVNTRNNGTDFKPQSLLIPSTNQVYYTLFDGPAGPSAGGLLRSATGPSGLAQTLYPDGLTGCAAAPGAASGSAFKVVQTSGNRAYLLRYDGMPYRSIDNFASTSAVCVNAPNTGYERIAFNDVTENPTNSAILVAATSKGIFRSVDSGANFARAAISGLTSQVLSSIAYVSTIIFGVDRSGGFYCSTDNGTTWQAANLGGLPAVPFRELKVMNGSLHILTDGGGVYNGFAGTCP